MPNIKFSELTVSADLLELDYIVGIRYVEETDSFQNFTYKAESFKDYLKAQLRQIISVSEDGNSITNPLFENNEVQALLTDNSVYLKNVDFTQDGNTITGVIISFYTSQKILVLL
jgi:hypothetical protein